MSLAVGMIYMTGCMIQVDLAARVCPPEATGTLFALLMATCNMGTAISTWFGGVLYRFGADRFRTKSSFCLLIGVGSLFTMGCWLIVRFLPASLLTSSADRAESPDRPGECLGHRNSANQAISA